MKLYDYFFYNLYQWYDDQYSVHKSKRPGMMAAVMIAVHLLGHMIILNFLIFKFLVKTSMPDYSGYLLSIIGLIIGGVVVIYYDDGKKYFKIQESYKRNGIPYQIKNPKLFSFLFLLFPFVFIVFIALF